MYKVLEITEIVGAFCAEGRHDVSISISQVKRIMAKVNERDRFVSTRLSRNAIVRALELANIEEYIVKDRIPIPNGQQAQSRFIREYYKMDSGTRSILLQIIKEFENETY